jgi:hypothetical protein
MSRKTIAWIIIGVLAAVVVEAVGVVSYRAGFDHGVSSGVVRRVRMPMAGMNGNGVEFGYRVVRVGAFPGLGLLVGLLAVGAIGALIAYLVSSGGRAAPVALPGPSPSPGSGGPNDVQWQQFLQWQQFEQWHRQMHSPAVQAPTASDQPVGEQPLSAPPELPQE